MIKYQPPPGPACSFYCFSVKIHLISALVTPSFAASPRSPVIWFRLNLISTLLHASSSASALQYHSFPFIHLQLARKPHISLKNVFRKRRSDANVAALFVLLPRYKPNRRMKKTNPSCLMFTRTAVSIILQHNHTQHTLQAAISPLHPQKQSFVFHHSN